MFLARWFGVQDNVIRGWTPFLRQMHRAFLVRHEPGDAVHSDCGLPGGDGLSCVGMVLLDFSFHLYMQHFQPWINELSFVDNLELISTCPGGLIAGVGTLETWADLFRLRTDSRKTQYWALKPQHRQLLLSFGHFGLPVVECTSDLGATMQYSAKHLNRPLQQCRKASVCLGSFRFVETSNRGDSVHQQAGSFRFAWHGGSVRFGSCDMAIRFGSVRVV